jgi:hypothetical protein
MSLAWAIALGALCLTLALFWLGRIVGLRYPLSTTASVTTLVLWGAGVVCALVALPVLVDLLLAH